MNFNEHSKLRNTHSFLSPSSYHWLNYSEDKLIERYEKILAVKKGTEYHEFAAFCIRIGQTLPESQKTLNMYVNDAIGFKMTPEQILYYSHNCFGTADAICFRDNILRIHDYKSGEVPAKIEQLEIYAALFCLEYHMKPSDIQIKLRIYQNNEVLMHEPEIDEIYPIMDKIVTFDKILDQLNEER